MKLTRTLVIFTLAIFSFSILYSQDSLESIVTWELDDDAQFRCSNRNRGGSDLNNDGYDDYIHWDPSDYDNYKFQFFMGKEVPDTTYDFEIDAPFGSGYISWGGDLNADGYQDIIYNKAINWEDPGDIYICLGGDSIDLEPELILHGENYAPDPYHLCFKGINGGYDFNGDGYDDILAGGYGPSELWNGQVDLFFGGDTLDSTSEFHIQGGLGDELGKYKTAGDINGDGYDDLIISRNIEFAGPLKYEIYLGGPNMDTVMDYEIEEIYGYYWTEPCAYGDINNDSFNDLIIPTFMLNLYYGNNTGNIILNNQITQSYDIVSFFYTNINNDDYSDFFVLVGNEDNIYIYYGKEDSITEPDITLQINGLIPLYYSIACNVGDFNGDGKDEILVNTGNQYTGDTLNSATMYGLHGGNDIDNNEEEITDYEIINAYPNPFSSTAKIKLSLPMHVRNPIVEIYNIKCQKIKTLPISPSHSPTVSVVWDGTNRKNNKVSSGIYFINLSVNTRIQATRKIIFMR